MVGHMWEVITYYTSSLLSSQSHHASGFVIIMNIFWNLTELSFLSPSCSQESLTCWNMFLAEWSWQFRRPGLSCFISLIWRCDVSSKKSSGAESNKVQGGRIQDIRGEGGGVALKGSNDFNLQRIGKIEQQYQYSSKF